MAMQWQSTDNLMATQWQFSEITAPLHETITISRISKLEFPHEILRGRS